MIKISDKIIKYGLYLIVFLPLVFTPFTYFPWHFGKTMIFQIIVEVMLFIWLISLWWNKEKSRIFKLNWLDGAVFIFLVIILITSLTGANFSNSFWGNQSRANGVLTWLHFGFFYFLLKQFFTEKKDWRNLFILNTGVAFLVSLTAIFPQLLPTSLQAVAGGGIIGNRAFLASYLLLSAGLAAYLLVSTKNKWRYLFIGAILVNLIAIYLSDNRGSLVGLLAGIAAGLVFYIFSSSTKKIKIITGSVLGFFCLLFLAFLLLAQNPIWQNTAPRLSNAFNFRNYVSGTVETRLMAWEIAWQGIKTRPLLGWGWGNYNILFDKYYNPEFLKFNFSETVWDKPHNWLLEIGDSVGVLGVLSYAAILFFAGYLLFKTHNDNLSPIQKSIFLAVLLAYFVQDLFLFETTNGLFLWFAILAFISVSFSFSRQSSLSFLLQSFKKIISLFLFVGFVFALYYFNYLPLKSSYYLQKATSSDAVVWANNAGKALQVKTAVTNEGAIFLAEYLVNLDKANAIGNYQTIKKPAVDLANFLEQVAGKQPQSLKFPTWAGQVYMVLGEKVDEKYFAEAEKILLQAKNISPRKQETLFLLARSYLLEKKFPQAIATNKEAVAVEPKIAVSHWFLGLAYGAAGDVANSLTQIEYIRDVLKEKLTKDQILYLIDLYAANKQFSKVVEAYEQLVREEPANLNWYIKLASAYALNGNKDKAISTIDFIVREEPSLKDEAEKFIKENNLR